MNTAINSTDTAIDRIDTAIDRIYATKDGKDTDMDSMGTAIFTTLDSIDTFIYSAVTDIGSQWQYIYCHGQYGHSHR